MVLVVGGGGGTTELVVVVVTGGALVIGGAGGAVVVVIAAVVVVVTGGALVIGGAGGAVVVVIAAVVVVVVVLPAAGVARGGTGGRINPLSTNATTAAASSAAARPRDRMRNGAMWPRIKATTPTPKATNPRTMRSPPTIPLRIVTMLHAAPNRSSLLVPARAGTNRTGTGRDGPQPGEGQRSGSSMPWSPPPVESHDDAKQRREHQGVDQRATEGVSLRES